MILGNKDASSLVEYKLKEPFISRTVRIYPSSPPNDPICLRMELYGCYPNPGNFIILSVNKIAILNFVGVILLKG